MNNIIPRAKNRRDVNLRGKGIKWLSLVLSFLVVLSITSLANAPITLPSVSVDPAVSSANPGEAFDVNINVAGVTDLYSWGLKLQWNPNVIEVAYYFVGAVKRYNITEGAFLKDGTTSPLGTSFVAKAYLTYIDAGCTTLGAYPGVSGSGTLFTVTFKPKDSGTSSLDIDEVTSKLLDSTITAMDHVVQDGSFYTTARANLVAKSAWPEHHHFVVGKDEDGKQTLFAKVVNLGPLDLYVYVTFDMIRDDGFIVTVDSATTVIAAGATAVLSADFALTASDAGKYYVNTTAMYSWTGFYFTQGEKMKAFSFAVVP